MTKRICSVDGCENPRRSAIGLCSTHRKRLLVHGSTLDHVPVRRGQRIAPVDWRSRFYSYVDVGEPDECWPWTAYVNPVSGYGIFRYQGSPMGAHRAALILEEGFLGPDYHALHLCPRRDCVNIAHLRWGTSSENMRDKVEWGDWTPPDNRGSRHGMSKLTEDQVRAIRVDGRTHQEIAADYGVSRRTIGDIKRGRSWAHIT